MEGFHVGDHSLGYLPTYKAHTLVTEFLFCCRGHVGPCYLQAEWLFMYSCWRKGNHPALWKSCKRQGHISDVWTLVLLLFFF